MVRVSQINDREFCVDINSFVLLMRRGAQEKIEAVSNLCDSSLFDDRERVTLCCAEAMTRTDQGVDDALFTQLNRFFDEDALVELTGLIAFQNMSSKFYSALAAPPEGFCALPVAVGNRSGAARNLP